MEGEVIEALRNRMFRIRLDNGHRTRKLLRFVVLTLGAKGIDSVATLCVLQIYEGAERRYTDPTSQARSSRNPPLLVARAERPNDALRELLLLVHRKILGRKEAANIIER
jgi:hypothetical protein